MKVSGTSWVPLEISEALIYVDILTEISTYVMKQSTKHGYIYHAILLGIDAILTDSR